METEMTKVRLQKFMAACGIASRRKSEVLIASGKVSINGEVVSQPYILVDPLKDEVKVNGEAINVKREYVYIIMNKPSGVLTTSIDPFGRKTVLSLIESPDRVYPVGRLDLDTEGLLLLTNDGEMAFRLTHPRKEVEKEYIAVVEGRLDQKKKSQLRAGADIGGYVTAPAIVNEVDFDGKNSTHKVVIKEGKKRQVRLMFKSIGHKVVFLKRVRLGTLELGDLKPGQWRYLVQTEIDDLKKITGGN